MARKKIIAGNWKMNMTPSQAVELINTLKPLVANDEVDVLLCVPAIDIIPAMEAAKGSNIMIGAENMYFEEKGAFTGEISPAMLDDAGVKYQTAELGRVNAGGGGTIAYIPAKYGMNVIDSGVAVLSMHSPWEVTSKADIYEAYKGYKAFLNA